MKFQQPIAERVPDGKARLCLTEISEVDGKFGKQIQYQFKDEKERGVRRWVAIGSPKQVREAIDDGLAFVGDDGLVNVDEKTLVGSWWIARVDEGKIASLFSLDDTRVTAHKDTEAAPYA